MLKTVLVTGSIGMVVGFAGSLLTLFGGGTLSSEYVEFAVALILFVVILIGLCTGSLCGRPTEIHRRT
jgi:hypothetical protein